VGYPGGMQRVGAGSLRGRVLRPLPATIAGVRPTGSRVREAIFDRLHLELPGAVVLDLFAGSGALAIEALSRGAARATLVEQQANVVRFLREQIRELALAPRVTLWQGEARDALKRGPSTLGGPFSLVLLDPPYEQTAALLPALLSGLVAGWLEPGAIVVCEYDRAGPGLSAAPEGLRLETSKRYGQVGVDFLRWDPGASR
jgi:16S rRNA (guanine966-N2)-methyltransferase